MVCCNPDSSLKVGVGDSKISCLPQSPLILGSSLEDVLATAGDGVDTARVNALFGDLDGIVRAVVERTKHSKSEDDCQNLELAICTRSRIPSF